MPRPANLIFFLSDNHNGAVLGCQGHPIAKTPTMDKIAARGARFRTHYCSSTLCCPSRATIASGLYPHQTGYWDNCLAYDGRAASWGHAVRELGGTTASVGKLHFRSTEDDNGFDEEIAPMHILGGVGSLTHLLRWNGNQPPAPGQWDLYWRESGVGETEYQDYDREITRLAIDWLTSEGCRRDTPWVLLVSYVSAHPPFKVPQRFFDMFPPASMPLPSWFRPQERPMHPALQHLRDFRVYQAMDDEARLRAIAAGYFGLVAHLDEQMGEVMACAESLGLLEDTRILYTSDHGESFGHHGLFGKNHLLETAARVPLLMCGPDIAPQVIDEVTQSVDLFPTVVAGAGGDEIAPGERRGLSLWPALNGEKRERAAFAEFHASGSVNGSFLWRQGNDKLIYHVDARRQLYDLGTDPSEGCDEFEAGRPSEDAQVRADALEAAMREWVDPEAVDARAKADQHAAVERHGGEATIRQSPAVVYTPPPGSEAWVDPVV